MNAYEGYRCAKCMAIAEGSTPQVRLMEATHCCGSAFSIWICGKCGKIHGNEVKAERCCSNDMPKTENIEFTGTTGLTMPVDWCKECTEPDAE